MRRPGSGYASVNRFTKAIGRKDVVSFNRVIIAGNLTRDPELRFTNGGVPVCSFGMAVNRVRSKTEEVDFFDVSAWRELGETIANYKKKGDPILVEGRLQFRSWEAQDGSKRNKSRRGRGQRPVPRPARRRRRWWRWRRPGRQPAASGAAGRREHQRRRLRRHTVLDGKFRECPLSS